MDVPFHFLLNSREALFQIRNDITLLRYAERAGLRDVVVLSLLCNLESREIGKYLLIPIVLLGK